MVSNKFTFTLMVAALAWGSHPIRAQEVALEYTSEWQTDFNGAYNWLNLLRLSGALPLSQSVTLEGATISIARTGADVLIDDLQGYSNIEADPLPLGVAVLGARLQLGSSSLFAGIRNVGEDYFTSPATSLFANSSCGIFPTLSANYDIANYPLSGWCLHYRYESERWAVQTSLYEGRGHSRIAGHDNIFTISPSANGVFSITSADYTHHGSNYTLGCAVYYGVRGSDDDAGALTPSQAPTSKSLSIAPWINIEQRLSPRCTLLLQGSLATAAAQCHTYVGAGATYQFDRLTAGLFTDYARYHGHDEFVGELTCTLPLTPIITLQPTVDAIVTDGTIHPVGLMRVIVNL